MDQIPIIMITYDESNFSANDGYQKIWTFNGQKVLQLKRKWQRIMVSNFWLPWSRLNLLLLSSKNRKSLWTQWYQEKLLFIFSTKNLMRDIRPENIYWIRLLKKLYLLEKLNIQVMHYYFSLTMLQVIEFIHKMRFRLRI